MSAKQKVPPIPQSVLEGICRILGETNDGLSGTEIGLFLQQASIPDTDPSITKWKRLYNAFANFQNRNHCSNNILTFITGAMNPARFIGKNEQFEDMRFELNKRLSFVGMAFTERGTFSRTSITTTITEAEQKASRLKSKLESRNVHPKILEYCKAEYLADNYFHTVFEAVKSVADTIRQRTGLSEDGAPLIDRAFSISHPLITINDLTSETKESEHKGFANLIKGVFGMFRNTLAHAPRYTWEIEEEDALDILSTISLIHRRMNTPVPSV